MISASQPITNSGQCLYYLEMAQSGYYANRHEKAGYWAGEGAKLLGLAGTVEQEPLQHLFDGFSPDGKTALVQKAGSSKRH